PSAQGVRQADAETGSTQPRTEWWAGRVSERDVQIGVGTDTDDELGLGEFMDWEEATFFGNRVGIAGANPDVAAGLAAYRDRAIAQPRIRSNPRFFSGGVVSADVPGPFSYATSRDASPNFVESLLDNRYGEDDPNSRFLTRPQIAGVDGLRGTPGFGSLGEMLMASVRTDDISSFNPIEADEDRLFGYPQLSTQQFASDGRNLGVSGSDEDAVSLSPNFVPPGEGISSDANRAGTTPDDYVEKLATAAGVMNMTTTRSDFFAVWMVVQGFRESDVATLRENDPLVPSFRRRYLMVLDRSNVLETGDRPRVVLMREVPL
ncbi:MAG: hypothetical protein AAGA55_08845, partial [Planctomycetota bacterium]